MVIQNMLRTRVEETGSFFKYIKLAATLDLTECLIQIKLTIFLRMCVPNSDKPSSVSTMSRCMGRTLCNAAPTSFNSSLSIRVVDPAGVDPDPAGVDPDPDPKIENNPNQDPISLNAQFTFFFQTQCQYK